MRSGWISLYRDLLDKPIWILSTPEQKTILITLLLLANHDENKWEFNGNNFTIKPGQLVTSLKSIANKSGKGVSIQNARTALARFEKDGFLTNESTNQNRLITICNWDKYQCKTISVNKAYNRQLTDRQQTNNRQLTTNNNVNKEEKEKKKELKDLDFENFWNLYDKKVGDKGKILKIWQRLTLTERRLIFDTLPSFLKSNPDKKFQPYPEKYLNNKRWNDEIQQLPLSNSSDRFIPQPLYR